MINRQQLLDLQFVEMRHKLLDLAAFLDRLERSNDGEDFRAAALQNVLPILLETRPDRAAAILDALSDSRSEVPVSAPFQGAFGAPKPSA